MQRFQHSFYTKNSKIKIYDHSPPTDTLGCNAALWQEMFPPHTHNSKMKAFQQEYLTLLILCGLEWMVRLFEKHYTHHNKI